MEPTDITIASDQASGMLGVTTQTLYNWVKTGKLAAVKTGDNKNAPLRFRLSDIQAIQERRTVKAA